MKRVILAAATLTLSAALGAGAQQSPQANPAALKPQTSPPAATAPMTARQAAEMRGDLLMARKMYSEAIDTYQTLLKQEPRNAPLLNKIGIAYHQQAMLNEAERYFRRAVKADKSYATAINNLGTIEYDHRKYRKAIRLYQRALKLRDDSAAFYSNLGYAYLADKKYDEAVASLQRALQLDPALFEHHSGIGAVMQQRSMTNPAEFYFFLAKTYAMLGDAERCAHYLKMARDEGFKNLAQARKDPGFAKVLADPRVREVIEPSPPGDSAPPSSRGE
jgi:tetratricopeptide (TPR) repeat protein